MDRNSAIGLTLIAGILLVYFTWFSPTPTPPAKNQTTTTTQPATLATPEAAQQPVVPDSVLKATYGDLSTAMAGQEQTTQIKTEDVAITFSNRGGIIKELELLKFKTYDQKPLKLITADNNVFSLITNFQGKDVDLYTLYYQTEQKVNGDTTEVTYSVVLNNGARLAQVYKIPHKGFEIGYSLTSTGFDQQLSGDNVTLLWTNLLKPIEKDLQDTRINSTVTYYNTQEEKFKELSARSTEVETDVLATPIKWVAIKEKFFLTSIISKGTPFTSGEVQTSLTPADFSIVKKANIKLLIPRKSLADGKAAFKFYVGPNDYQVVGKVTESFGRNVYLGWGPIYWINKFVIFPVFHFLTQFITSYGLIIVILVLLLKLVLLPLSYRSYLSMAKMKVLKPELDEIKERVGEDMTKVQQEQMKLYQQVGVNPISGCVPVLLQMPLIFAMFYLFPASIELRQEHFLWAEDLSTYDSLIQLPFSLPVLGSHISLFTLIMTISTLVYTWQNNQLSSVTGPMKSMSYIMPVVFFFVLNTYASGLTFYYFISNLVTFAQQGIIRRFVDEDKIRLIMEENRKKNAAGGGGKKSKFMSRLEDAMKASEVARKKTDDDKKKKK